MAQTVEVKRKTRFISSFTIMQLLMYTIVFIVVIFVKKIRETEGFTSDFVTDNWILAVTNGVTAIFSIGLMIRSFSLYRQRKSLQNAYLAGFFLFTGIPSLILAVTTLLVPRNPDLRYFFSLAIFFLVPGSSVFLGTFISETFYGTIDQKLGQLLFFITQFSATIANIIGLLLVLKEHDRTPYTGWSLLLIQIFGGFFILLNMFLHFLLMYNAFRLRSKVEEKRLRAGLILLGITGILLGLVFFGRLFNFLLIDLTILGPYQLIFTYGLDILFFLGYVTMYLGVAIPGRKNN